MSLISQSFEQIRSVVRVVVALLVLGFGSDGRRQPVQAQAPTSVASADRSLSPYFVVEGELDPGAEAFPLERTDVTANVSGVIADVTVRQAYVNRGRVPINARYVFPGSTRAAVHGMWFQVGNKRVVAKIREREEAAEQFEQAKREGKTASLLEQERPNVFTMSLANVMPGDRVEVELKYTELMVPSEGSYQLVYPTVVGPRYAGGAHGGSDEHTTTTANAGRSTGERWVASPYLRAGKTSSNQTPSPVSIKVNLSAGMPVAEVRSPSHEGRAAIAWESPAVARVSLDGVAGDRDFVLDYRLAGGAIQSGLLLHELRREVTHDGGHERTNEGFFLLTVQPPARITPDQIPPREYVFVLDVSGSMHGFPLDTAKELMSSLFRRLRPTDSFNVVLFSGGSRVLAPSSLAATQENLARATAIIDAESGGGGTELAAALKTAMGLPRRGQVSRSVVVVTDGFIAEERETFELIQRNLERTNVFAFGIGASVNRHLVEGVARAGSGEPFVVTNPSEAPAAAERLRRYIEAPVMTEVRVEAEGFDIHAVEPVQQPDLFAERPVVVLGKWRGPRRGQLVVTGRTAAGPFRKAIDVASAPARAEHSALAQLWARSRIARLSDFKAGDDAEAKREVTSLGLTYSLLTRHTSFIAVLEAVRNPTSGAADVKQPLPLPAGVSEAAIEGGAYGSGAEPSVILLLALCALTIVLLRRRAAVAP